MGYMKSLKYTYGESDNKNANGEWLMTEYSLYAGYLGAREIKKRGYVICKIKKKGKSTSDENMNNVEELIDSSLQLEDDIIVEEDNVGDEVLAIMDKEDDGDRYVEC
uniref:NAC transcription factor n=1 Tax=Solanum tuberosum TaxID=4113 RepID=M1DAP0_SOLTU